MSIGGSTFVFRANPPRLVPVAPGTGGTNAGRKPNDFSDRSVFSIKCGPGVRDVNEVY